MLEDQRLVQLLLAVATAANEADKPEQAFDVAIDRICAFTEWPVGHVYRVEEGRPVSTQIWHLADPERFRAFQEATDAIPMGRGSGLPGRVYATGRPAWIADLGRDAQFMRAKHARAAGLQAGMAFPVLVGRRVAAVLEFFAVEPVPPDEGLLQVMSNIGGQLGRVVEREQAREALRASEERIRTFVEVVQDYAIFMLDAEGHVATWNAGGERIKGYREEEIVGRHFSTFYPSEDVASGKPARVLKIATDEGHYEDEGWRVRKDGTRFWANAIVTALRDAEGRVQGFTKVTRDLTERRRAEETLRESEARLARAQEIAHLGSWEWDVATGELRWSDEMYRIYGLTPGEGITYERYMALQHPADRERTQKVVEEALREGRPYRFYHRILRADDGAERILLGEGEVMLDGTGRVVKMFGTGHDVTEQKLAEEELRERERLLRRAQEIAHFGSWEWNSATGELTWSDELYRIYGLEPGAETSYALYLSRLHPDDRAFVEETVAQAIRSQEPFIFQERVVRPDGSVRVLNSAGEVMADADGTIWLFGVCHDVTESVQAAEELRESERRFRGIFHSMFQLVGLLAPDGTLIEANEASLDFAGLTPEDVIGRPYWECPWWDHDPTVREQLREAVARAADGAFVRYEVVIRGRDDRRATIDFSVKSIRDDDGEVELIIAEGRDITERKEAEERFRLLLESAPDAMVIVRGAQIELVNAQAEKVFGYGREEMVGQPVEMLLPERYRAPSQRPNGFTTPYLTEKEEGLELYCRRRDGTEFPVEISLSPLQTHQGLLVSAAIRDITTRKQAEQAEARYRAALESRNRELQDFAYVASHDLQEPLRKIRAFSDLLGDEYAERLDDQARHYLKRMDDAAARMSDLIADLLAFSRVTTKGRPFEPVDLSHVAEGVLADLEIAIREGGASVEVEPLPTIEADPMQMRQLLQNLFANALKFSREGETPRVRVAARREPRNEFGPIGVREVCRITVQDNGIGFDEKYLDRIFTPFQRLHNRDAYKGTGMGLAICRRIVERHGGTITARSRPGEGSTFVVVLPVRQEPAIENEPG